MKICLSVNAILNFFFLFSRIDFCFDTIYFNVGDALAFGDSVPSINANFLNSLCLCKV